MPYQDELNEGRVVSIWVGNLDDEDAITGYLGQPFERDLCPPNISAYHDSKLAELENISCTLNDPRVNITPLF